ncbi:MAG TPA: biotin/lipoyl-containing protein [Chloroflexota bacterium]|nr:biotin/lipoyl-containing protein [Chloroflexota bacterium]
MAEEDAGVSTGTVQAILRTIEETDVERLELTCGSISIQILQEPGAPEPADNADVPDAGTVAIIAPLTGVFYARPTPDQEPFIQVGSSVSNGQTIGLIETMKLFNEVVAEVEGLVEVIPVRDGDLVEKGQALAHIRPEKGAEE